MELSPINRLELVMVKLVFTTKSPAILIVRPVQLVKCEVLSSPRIVVSCAGQH